ncbi:MAG: DUF4351 domain-containing protein [Acidobacteria bacterium]|nr:DUF4351 domain-containing protein [Acidobacteriota bacterium]
MPIHDRLSKELLRVFFLEFITLFWPKLAALIERDSIEFLQQEIFTDVTAGERHEADLVVLARLAGLGGILFQVESQGTARSIFPERMFSYFSRFHLARRLPVFPIAVLTYDSPREQAIDYYDVTVGDEPVMSFKFRVVQLNRLDWRDYEGCGNPVAYGFMSQMRMMAEERKLVKLESLRSTLALGLDPARTQLIFGYVNTYLRLKPEEEEWVVEALKISNPDQGLFWTYWHEAGMVNVAEQVLKRRLGELPESTMARIRALPPEKIVDLTECARDFPTASSLDEWLAANANGGGPV